VYALSDSTGNLARHMLCTFLTQFPAGTFAVEVRAFLHTPAAVEEALAEAALNPGVVVVHALVSAELKGIVERRCAEIGVPCCDLTGRFIAFLSAVSGTAPTYDRGLLHNVAEAYHRRVEALEFTLAHDDGLGLDTLADADVVLTGVSRTSKTPTSIYLAQQGYRVANVSLAMAVDPPAQLLALPKGKVVAVAINPRRLTEIRARRQQAAWRMERTGYSDPKQVAGEVIWSRRLFDRQGWPVLDITDQAIEETAACVVELVGPPPQVS